jgi:hypothetical protein
MMLRLPLALILCLAALPVAAQHVAPDLPPDYPPKMGDIAGTLGKQAVAWETYDFSVGAFDASAWIGRFDGVYRVSLLGYPPGEPEARAGRLLIRATYADLPVAGAVPTSVQIEISDTENLDEGPRLSSKARGAEVTLTAISREDYAYGMIAGKAVARLCPVGGKEGGCKVIAVTFDSRLQYDSIPES